MALRKVAEENGKIMFIAFLALNDMGIGKKKILEMWLHFVQETVPEWQRNCNDGISDRKLTEIIRRMNNITYKDIKETTFALKPDVEPCNVHLLAENLAVLCIEINKTFGFGGIRLNKMMELMREYKGNAFQDVQERLGVELEQFGFHIPDASKYLPKKEKALSYSESQRIAAEMEAVRRIQGV